MKNDSIQIVSCKTSNKSGDNKWVAVATLNEQQSSAFGATRSKARKLAAMGIKDEVQ